MSDTLKKLLKGRPTNEEIGSIFFEMGEDGARGSILAGTSFLEDVLKGAIVHRFSHLTETERRDLFEGTAPLSTFSAKIKIAYAMGVIGKLTRHDLEKMRELRNAAAHSTRHITFKLPAIANLISSLNSLKDVTGGTSFSAQHKFVSCVNQIMNALVGKMHTPPFKIQGIKHLD